MNSIRLQLQGDNPASNAQRVLGVYTEDSDVESITIEIETAANSSDSDLTTFAEQENDDSKEISVEESTDDGRERRDIQKDTSHHHVLCTLSSLNAEQGPVAGRLVRDKVRGVSESSIFPALTQLWERKLAERERVEDAPNPYFEYWCTEHGEQTLEELGEPEKTYMDHV